jgi:hypothetical protein
MNFSIELTSSKGRSIVATADLPESSLILNEVPLACLSLPNIGMTELQKRFGYRNHELKMISVASKSLKKDFNGQAIVLASRLIEATNGSMKRKVPKTIAPITNRTSLKQHFNLDNLLLLLLG